MNTYTSWPTPINSSYIIEWSITLPPFQLKPELNYVNRRKTTGVSNRWTNNERFTYLHNTGKPMIGVNTGVSRLCILHNFTIYSDDGSGMNNVAALQRENDSRFFFGGGGGYNCKNTHKRRTRQTATQTRMLPTTVPTMMNNKTALMRIVSVRL